MYEAFYRLKSEPFRLSPDPKFCFPHRTYRKAMVYMRYALNRAEGFIMITGQPGTGKTTLINDLLGELRSERVVFAKLVSTQLAAEDLLRLVAYSFGMDTEGMDKAGVLIRLERFLIQQYRQGRRALLIVDEAQDVPQEALEELRLLTNMLVDSQPLLQIFLVGQEQLRDVISMPALVQLHQRLIAASHLEPLDVPDTAAYIRHRLQRVGWTGDPLFSNEAYALIQQYSKGIPREINQICSRLLLHGSTEELHRLRVEDVRLVINELSHELLLPMDLREISGTDLWYGDAETETYDEEAGSKQEVTESPQPRHGTWAADDIAESAGRVDREISEAGDDPVAVEAGGIEEEMPAHEQVSPLPEEDGLAVVSVKGLHERSEDVAVEPDPVAVSLQQEEAAANREQRRAGTGSMLLLFTLFCGLLFALWYETARDTGRLSGHEIIAWIRSIGHDMPFIKDIRNTPDESVSSSSVNVGEVVRSAPQVTKGLAVEDKSDTGEQEAGHIMPVKGETGTDTLLFDVAAQTDQAGGDSLYPDSPEPDAVAVMDNHVVSGAPVIAPDSEAEPVPEVKNADEEFDVAQPVLIDELARSGMKVSRLEDDTLMVNLSGDGVFDFDSVEIREESGVRLTQLADILRRYDDRMEVMVVGHTDSKGAESYNLHLSQRRAQAVADYLIGLKLPLVRIESEGRGDLDTRFEESTRDRPELKRRVEIYIRRTPGNNPEISQGGSGSS